MTGEFDVGSPTLQVNVYEDGVLVARVPCESAEDAAEVVSQWEEREGVRCEVEDLAVAHDPDAVLAPEPEDGMLAQDDREDADQED